MDEYVPDEAPWANERAARPRVWLNLVTVVTVIGLVATGVYAAADRGESPSATVTVTSIPATVTVTPSPLPSTPTSPVASVSSTAPPPAVESSVVPEPPQLPPVEPPAVTVYTPAPQPDPVTVQAPPPPPPPPVAGAPVISAFSCTRQGQQFQATVSFNAGGLPGTVAMNIGPVPLTTQFPAGAGFSSASATISPHSQTCTVTVTTSAGSDSSSAVSG